MELSLEQIHTYLHCPAKYQFQYEYKLGAEEADKAKFKKAMHKSVYYLYYSMMGGFVPSAKQMKDKWAAMWEEEKKAIQDKNEFLLREKKYVERTKIDKHVVLGLEMIHNFYHYNKEKHGVPIAVNHEFKVPIAGIMVTGNFELIRESIDNQTSSRFIEIVDFKTGTEDADGFLVNNDLNLTVMAYAFRNLFQATEDRLTYNYLKTGKEIITKREERHFERMRATIEGVAEGIANKRFYPRQTFMCKSCPVKDVCELARF